MSQNEPKNGDFASMLAAMASRQQEPAGRHAHPVRSDPGAHPAARSYGGDELTPEQVAALIAEVEPGIIESQGRTKAELDALAELQDLPGLSEEELARQAMEHPGADGDPGTAE